MIKLLHLLPPELAHQVAILLLKNFPVSNQLANFNFDELSQNLMGLHFPHPLGLAAGFDKHGDVIHKLGLLGFSFIEIGSVTPQPQPGNPKPRLFRLSKQQAIINRYGFNSKGLEYMLAHLKSTKRTCITGVNLGKNKQNLNFPLHCERSEALQPPCQIDDFLYSAKNLVDQADYFTLNISSPNTIGLRSLQKPTLLKPILDGLNEICKTNNRSVPLLVKLSPDMPINEEAELIHFLMEQPIEGLILSNTTLIKEGGLSGAPLKKKANAMLKRVSKITQGKLILIASGGISSGQDAYERLKAGAHLLQIYTSFIYQGPAVILRILNELMVLFNKDGVKKIKDICLP